MVGINLHNMKNIDGTCDAKGANPFDNWYVERAGQRVYLSQLYSIYDWVLNDGYRNLGEWIESAARMAGR